MYHKLLLHATVTWPVHQPDGVASIEYTGKFDVKSSRNNVNEWIEWNQWTDSLLDLSV